MSEWVRISVQNAYLKIAEPRVTRIIQFGIYVGLMIVGIMIFSEAPNSFERAIGPGYTIVFAFFLIIGGLCSGIAVLPGIWWLERSGLMLLSGGLLIYMVMIIWLNSSPVGIIVSLIMTLTFVQRWLEIKGAQLAPLLPKKRG